MDKDYPLVTVAVPCYNHERFVAECIESIVNQTYQNIELIVIDDGSIDRSPEILSNLQKKYDFKLILQTNQGAAKTINNILRNHTHGIYFSPCASDDYWLPTKIEKQVAFMETNCFYPMCYGKTFFVDQDSKIIEKANIINDALKCGWLFDDILLLKLHPPVNYMYRTAVFNEVGYFDERLCAEDYDMNLKISSKYTIGFLDEYIGFYRMPNTEFKIERFDQVADSHLFSIEGFKDHPLYATAKTSVYLTKFDTFSGFTKHKKKAIKNGFKSLPLCLKKRFLVACIKLVAFWK